MTVRNERLAATRELSLQQAGIIATFRIRSEVDTPVDFRLIDRLPAALSVKTIGFHPEHRPDRGHLNDRRVVIGGRLDPSGEQVVEYGICQKHPALPKHVQNLQQSALPTIARAELADAEQRDQDELSLQTSTRSPTSAPGFAPGPSGFLSRLKRLVSRVWSRRWPAMTDGPRSGNSADRIPSPTPDQSAQGPGPTGQEVGTSDASGPTRDQGDLFDRADSRSDAWQNRSEGASPAEGTSGEGIDDTARSDTPSRVDHEGSSGQGGHSGDDIDVAGHLLDAFESGRASSHQRERLGTRLLDVGPRSDPIMPGVLSRLDSLETRVDTLEPYRAELEAVLSMQEPTGYPLSEFGGQLDALGRSINQISAELERGATRRQSIHDRLNHTDELVQELALDLRWLDGQITALATTDRWQTAGMEVSLARLDRVVERVDELAAESRAIDREIARLDTGRTELVEALSQPPVDGV